MSWPAASDPWEHKAMHDSQCALLWALDSCLFLVLCSVLLLVMIASCPFRYFFRKELMSSSNTKWNRCLWQNSPRSPTIPCQFEPLLWTNFPESSYWRSHSTISRQRATVAPYQQKAGTVGHKVGPLNAIAYGDYLTLPELGFIKETEILKHLSDALHDWLHRANLSIADLSDKPPYKESGYSSVWTTPTPNHPSI